MRQILMHTSPEQWKEAGLWLTYRNHQIFYRDSQNDCNAVLVCIHGFPTSSWDWHQLWPALTKRFRVIAFDMIGFGFSDKPKPYPYSLFDQATLHEVLLHKLGIESVHILSHDYGDTVAQELLARRLENKAGLNRRNSFAIRSVCLLNGGIFPEVIQFRPIQKLLRGPAGGLIARLLTEKRFRKQFSAVFGPHTQPSEEELAGFWSMISYNAGLRVAHKISQYQVERITHRNRWVGALQQTIVPLRFIVGPTDPVSGIHMAKRYEELIPNPDVIYLAPNIGHYPQIEVPASVLGAYLSFVRT